MTLKYPETPQYPITDKYFDQSIVDPYRWLEDDNSAETAAWVRAENEITDGYLSSIPFREKVRARLEVLWNYPKYGSPTGVGEWYYFYKNDGLQNQSVLYREPKTGGAPEVFLDPNQLASDGTVALSGVFFSKNGGYAAYTIARSGSDWTEAFVIEAGSSKPLSDHLHWLKFTALSWNGEDGFYYSRYPEPDEAARLSGQNEHHNVYYHRVGTPQSEDLLVYEDPEHPLRTVNAHLTEDKRFLCLTISEGTSGGEIRVRSGDGFALLIPGFDTEPTVIDNDGDKLLVHTNADAPNYKLVCIDPLHPEKENWVTVIPEQSDVLLSVSTGGGYLFAEYLKDAASRVFQYTYQGHFVREIALPGLGNVSGLGGKKTDPTFFYTYTSFNYPSTIFQYDTVTGTSSLFRRNEARFDPEQFETKQVFFPSADGVQVPMFLTYRKDLALNGENPVLLYGYGGFNVPLPPAFNISNVFFMEQGGIYAQVTLRGGSEYGEAWHRAGMLHQKQNVFNDMIAAAEYLIARGYTRKEKIAVKGGSNGGLLVGACMTQRPDLFRVAIPQVGVLDMLRFQKFTIGWAWVSEYGSSDNAADFDYLLGYSPYHNLRPGVSYPATLITTADHDDRVVPAHSFKFAARLQSLNNGPNPTLIRIDVKAGHGAGKPTSKVIEEAVDVWSFVMYNLGMTYQTIND